MKDKKNIKKILITLVAVLVLWPLLRKFFTIGAIVAMIVAFYFLVIRGKKS